MAHGQRFMQRQSNGQYAVRLVLAPLAHSRWLSGVRGIGVSGAGEDVAAATCEHDYYEVERAICDPDPVYVCTDCGHREAVPNTCHTWTDNTTYGDARQGLDAYVCIVCLERVTVPYGEQPPEE